MSLLGARSLRMPGPALAEDSRQQYHAVGSQGQFRFDDGKVVRIVFPFQGPLFRTGLAGKIALALDESVILLYTNRFIIFK